MSLPAMKKGDVFCVDSNSIISRAIKLVEKFHSHDNQAEFNHAGVILDKHGTTFEALWRVKESQISNYKGENILIARPKCNVNNGPIISHQIDCAISNLIRNKKGHFYPLHRLFLHFLGPVAAKYISTGDFDVCSEMVTTDYLSPSPLFNWRGNARGINPDTLADRLQMDTKMYEVIFKGELKL